MASGRFIAYYRVSTKRQGRSGLGLEAQKAAVAQFIGDTNLLIKEFSEVESGRNNGRPELQKALEACRLHQATLVIAKLDRLARNASFLMGLRDAGVEFVAVDMPQANRMTVGILAVVAEAEAEAISQRTKAALAAAKARGVKLGTAGPENLKKVRRVSVEGVKAVKAKADQRAKSLESIVVPMKDKGASFNEIAHKLNEEDIPTARGGTWSATQVRRILQRLNKH